MSNFSPILSNDIARREVEAQMFSQRHSQSRRLTLRLLAGTFAVLAFSAVHAAQSVAADQAFFREGKIPRLRIEISPAELARLDKDNRSFVRCTIREGDEFIYSEVGVHLKGAAGSFRPVGDRPALTLNFDKFREKQKFHGLDKLHLNNSVQDGSYLCEHLASVLFNAAGVPAPRVSHARVWLNGRDLGFYVLKEGFDTQFLANQFGSKAGNFYDGGFCADLDQKKSRKSGSGPDEQADLKALVAAAREPDLAKRAAQFGQTLAIDQFLSLVAMEMMTAHWDGYARNRNNYRLYNHPAVNKLVFLPSGMDQLFGDPNFPVFDSMGGLVTSGLWQLPQTKLQYRERVGHLLTHVFTAELLTNEIAKVHARVRPVLAEMNEGAAKNFDNSARDMGNRVLARIAGIQKQLGVQPMKPLRPDSNGAFKLAKWEAQTDAGDPKMAAAADHAGVKALEINLEKPSRVVASWRSRVLLDAGKYRFEGKIATQGVVPLKEPAGEGAGLRISGSSRPNQVSGDCDWKRITFEFDVPAAGAEVVLVCELRAEKGRAWFDLGSLQLARQN
ncbi:MAG: CotH kinase family protein [Verrucomicrobia bacterium]|nr:CotH kinase family protein [Verrucomicrobiota bacterium]